jgi:hypothetical protein
VRDDVGAVDVLMLLKGVGEASRSFRHLDADIALRQLDLLRSAISTTQHQRPLRGRRPSLDELEPGSTPDAGSPRSVSA